MAQIRRTIVLPTKYGSCHLHTFNGLSDTNEHFALSFGNISNCPLVRIHSSCITGDLLGSLSCDCGDQLEESIQKLKTENGILLYLIQEGRGIGLYNKIDSYHLQKNGHDTYKANELLNFPHDLRSYQVAAEMLNAFKLKQIILLSNNPDKARQLEEYGIKIVQKISTKCYERPENIRYLNAKIEQKGHYFGS